NSYRTLNRFNIYQLHCIPLSRTLIPHNVTFRIGGGLVGIWITNELRFRDFVPKSLFLQWGIEFIGE
ncbi:hypothetical protein L873DRAFT_191201, partial [Choiromyces venosus 120613-1]